MTALDRIKRSFLTRPVHLGRGEIVVRCSKRAENTLVFSSGLITSRSFSRLASGARGALHVGLQVFQLLFHYRSLRSGLLANVIGCDGYSCGRFR